jgi:tRNA(Arg) A34 adenosine deaminase TadA
MNESDHRFLRKAIMLASAARQSGNMPFGSILVGPDEAVLAEERNTAVTQHDITAHPELKLARWAAQELDHETARRSTMFTSCEPCLMCRGAIARSGLGRVVFALSDKQLQALKPPGAPAPDLTQVDYEGPAMFDEARVPLDGYYR